MRHLGNGRRRITVFLKIPGGRDPDLAIRGTIAVPGRPTREPAGQQIHMGFLENLQRNAKVMHLAPQLPQRRDGGTTIPLGLRHAGDGSGRGMDVP